MKRMDSLLDVDTARLGLPRPVAEAPDGKLRPVPQTQKDDTWGLVDEARHHVAVQSGNCLVCGESVEEGFVYWIVKPLMFGAETPAPVLATHATCETYYRNVADSAPLHPRCEKITRSHCQHIREKIHAGEFLIVPYVREAPKE